MKLLNDNSLQLVINNRLYIDIYNKLKIEMSLRYQQK